MVLKDNCQRPLLNLRIAVTKRCNLRCEYCHREGENSTEGDSPEEMAVDEIIRIAKVAVKLGMSKVKLTGGEPLMRKDISEIVKEIARIKGLTDLSMTTNGTMFESSADELHENGLRRVNITLPTLDREIYGKLTGGDIEYALKGVRAAVSAGFYPVKLNMLVLKGVNDQTAWEMIDFARKTEAILQLIELEPINIDDAYFSTYHRSLDDLEDALKQKALRVETRPFMQNRHIYHLPEGKVEAIHPIENADFCRHCTRLRVTSDGKLKPCLMTNDNLIDALSPMRNGASDDELAELFMLTNLRRQPYNKN